MTTATTSRQVNVALRKAGLISIELVKGAGYFYFTGEKADSEASGVYVYRIGELSIEEWIDEAKSRYTGEDNTK